MGRKKITTSFAAGLVMMKSLKLIFPLNADKNEIQLCWFTPPPNPPPPVPHRRRWPALWPPCVWITIRWKSKTSTPPAIHCSTRGAREPLLGRRAAPRAVRINETTRGPVDGRTADGRGKQLIRARKKGVREGNLWKEWRESPTKAGAGC